MRNQNAFSTLTSRENEVLILVCRGHSNKEIATQLVISQYTVEYHLKNIYQKLEVTRRSQAIAKALKD
jgi:RNA polymerase sigma factor (sigma-70 family)